MREEGSASDPGRRIDTRPARNSQRPRQGVDSVKIEGHNPKSPTSIDREPFKIRELSVIKDRAAVLHVQVTA